MKILNLRGFRMVRNPMFDYSLFAPATEEEWVRLEKALDKDAVLELIDRNLTKTQKIQGYATLEIGWTSDGAPILFTAYRNGNATSWFAGICYSKSDKQYREHAKARVESALSGGDGTIFVIRDFNGSTSIETDVELETRFGLGGKGN